MVVAVTAPPVTTSAAVNPVVPAGTQPAAPAAGVNSVVAAVPPTANALAPNAAAPRRREKALFFIFMPVSLSQRSDNCPVPRRSRTDQRSTLALASPGITPTCAAGARRPTQPNLSYAS